LVNLKNWLVIGCLMLCLLLGSMSNLARACDPVAFNFDEFLKQNDLNHDGFLQRSELLDARFRAWTDILDKSITTPEAFVELDINLDHKISTDEIWNWGKYVHNTCADWPNKNPTHNIWRLLGF
jgi:hypothetical protein